MFDNVTSSRVLNIAFAAAMLVICRPVQGGDIEDCDNGETLLKTEPMRVLSACRRLAERGEAVAQYNLGLMYGNGWGVPQNDAAAVKWYRLAAEQGYDAAQNNLGNMYADGRGVPQNDAAAVKWYRLAAEQGLASAQYNLEFNYANGLGVPLDYVQAYVWLDLSAAGLLPEDYGAETIALRDRLTSMMTQAQIAKAKKMAAEWKAKPVQ